MNLSSESRPAPNRRATDSLEPVHDRDAHVEGIIPHWFLWTADALAMVAALGATVIAAPPLQQLVAPGGPLRFEALNWFGLPGGRLEIAALFPESLGMLLVTVPATLFTIGFFGGYRSIERLSRLRLYGAAVVGALGGLSAFTLVVFALRSLEWSRIFLFTYTFLSIVVLVASRAALRTYKFKRIATGRYSRATVLVGRPDDVGRLLERLKASSNNSYRLVGYFTTGEPAIGPADLPQLGTVDRVAATLVHTPIDLMIIVLPDRGAPWLGEVVRACDYMRVAVHITPQALVDLTPMLRDLRGRNGASPVPVPGIVLQPWDVDAGALFFKRLFDVCVASVLLMLLAPLFVAIAFGIKISTPKADVFYRWRVIGYRGRPFTGYKFTTMVEDADARKADLQALNEMTGPVFKIRNDPRVLPFGRFLRKFSLNELPQLWSVVVGDMSLVGPRPAGVEEIKGYEDWHKRKLSFRPGITCLWQVRGRNKISNFDDWVRLDLEYIDNWSFWLDMRILVRTAWVVVAGSGS